TDQDSVRNKFPNVPLAAALLRSMVPEMPLPNGPVPVSKLPEIMPLEAPLHVGLPSALFPVHVCPSADTVNVNDPHIQGAVAVYVPRTDRLLGKPGIGKAVGFPRFQSSAPTGAPCHSQSPCRSRSLRTDTRSPPPSPGCPTSQAPHRTSSGTSPG